MRHTHRYHAAVAAIAVITLIVLLIPAHLISFAEGEGGFSANIAGAAESQSQMLEYMTAEASSDGNRASVKATETAGEIYYFLPSFAKPTDFRAATDQAVKSGTYRIWDEKKGTYIDLPADISNFTTDEYGAYSVWIKEDDKRPYEAHVFYSSGVSSIFIISDDPTNYGREYIDSSPDHSNEAEGSMIMIEPDGIIDYNGRLTQIKGRGNSTWAAQKKPYRIKLKNKTSLIDGSDANKKWVLLANSGDPILIKDYTVKKMAMKLGLYNTPDVCFVDLYYDGEYRGNYTLGERAGCDGDIPNGSAVEGEGADALADHATVSGTNSYGYPYQFVENVRNPENISGPYLVELDNPGYAAERSWFQTSMGYFAVKSPEHASEEEIKYISELMQKGISEGEKENGTISDYFDIEALAKVFLINELVKNPDYIRYSSTYYIKPKDGQTVVAGPVWDFDRAFGTHYPELGVDYQSPAGWACADWCRYFRNKEFREALGSVYNAGFREAALNMRESLNASMSGIKQSAHMNTILWGVGHTSSDMEFASVESALNYTNDWLEKRIKWLDAALSDTPSVERLYGPTRYETAVEIAKASDSAGNGIVLCSGADFPDALAAASLAGAYDYPVLMTTSEELPEIVLSYLQGRSPENIFIIGGTGVISGKVETKCREFADSVIRLGGRTRYETAEAIYQYGLTADGGKSIWKEGEAILASGENFPDAVSISPYAAKEAVPILMSPSTGATADTSAVIVGMDSVVIVGGTGVISKEAEDRLTDEGVQVTRLAGATRYETNMHVAEWLMNKRGFNGRGAAVASSADFADALTGASYAAHKNVPLLIVADGHTCNAEAFLQSCGYNHIEVLWFFGGFGAVSQDAQNALTGIFNV